MEKNEYKKGDIIYINDPFTDEEYEGVVVYIKEGYPVVKFNDILDETTNGIDLSELKKYDDFVDDTEHSILDTYLWLTGKNENIW